MKYLQITSEERYTLAALKTQGLTPSAIARRLGRHRSTIAREVQRNHSRYDGSYRPSIAIERTSGRRSRSRRNRHFTVEDYRRIEIQLKAGWSPEQISGRWRRDGTLSISHETIYLHVWRDKGKGGNLHKFLRCARKKKRKRYRGHDSRGRLAGKRHISTRPASVETRKSIGHWEIDTVCGPVSSKGCIVTLAERKSGYAMIGKLKDRTMEATNHRTTSLLQKHPGYFKTITADNGSEFHGYADIELATGTTFYFATPYHSWERGSNENLNGLIRQYLPKRTNMDTLTQNKCNAITDKLNRRPRKRLGYRTPEESFYGF